MNAFVTDTEVVGETTATLFESLQASPVDSLYIFNNKSEDNNIYYRFQHFNGTSWVDLKFDGNHWNADDGDTGNDTLTPGLVKSFKLSSDYPKIRVIASTTPSGSGNGGGTAELEFTISRYFAREAGGNLPILSF